MFCCVAPQCRQVKITILGEEGVPVQVDGEAWVQPPGIVEIVHKNRAQMLTRDRVKFSFTPFATPVPLRLPSNTVVAFSRPGLREHAQVLGGQEEDRELPRQQAPPQLPAVHGVPDGRGVRSGPAARHRGRRPHQQVSPERPSWFPGRRSLSLPAFPLSSRIREAAKTHKLVEQELAHAVNATALVLTEAKLSSPEVREPDAWTRAAAPAADVSSGFSV